MQRDRRGGPIADMAAGYDAGLRHGMWVIVLGALWLWMLCS